MTALTIPLAVVGRGPLATSSRVNNLDTRGGDAAFPTTAATLADLFPPIDALPDPYEWLTLKEGTRFSRSLPWASGRSVPGEDALDVYTPDGRQEGVVGNVVCRAMLADGDSRSAADRDEYHDLELWEEFDGEPTLERLTDWVKADLAEQQVDGHRRTMHWRRVPVLQDGPWRPQRDGDLPCREFAAAVQTTDWGVIHVGVYLASAPEEGRTMRIRDAVLERFHEQADRMPTPEPLGAALEHTAWTDLTATQRREAATAVAACPGDGDPTVPTVVEGLRRRYGPLSDDAETLVEAALAEERETSGEPGGDVRDV